MCIVYAMTYGSIKFSIKKKNEKSPLHFQEIHKFRNSEIHKFNVAPNPYVWVFIALIDVQDLVHYNNNNSRIIGISSERFI